MWGCVRVCEAPGVQDASRFVLEAVSGVLLELVDLLGAHRRRPLERLALVGAALGESGLADRDISVLTLQRGTQVIPNPRRSHVLEAGDRLLCFGKLEEMRSMIPSRRRRSRKVKRLPKEPIHEQ